MTREREVGRRRWQERRKQQKRLCRTMFTLCLLAFLLGVLCGRLAFAKERAASGQEETGGEEDAGAMAGGAPGTAGGALSSGQADKADWRLTLVNASHSLEDGYVPELAEIENNYYFDARAVGSLQEMLAEQGLAPGEIEEKIPADDRRRTEQVPFQPVPARFRPPFPFRPQESLDLFRRGCPGLLRGGQEAARPAAFLTPGGPRRRRQAFWRARWGYVPCIPQSPPLPAWWCGRARPRPPSGALPC